MRRVRRLLGREVDAGSRVLACRALGSVVAVVGVVAWAASAASAASPVVVQTFGPSGQATEQMFEVPEVASLQVTVQGADGGRGYPGLSIPGLGGQGTQITGTIAVQEPPQAGYQQLSAGSSLDMGVGYPGLPGTMPNPNGTCVINGDVSLGGNAGGNGFDSVPKFGGMGGFGDLCTGGGGGGGGGDTIVTVGFSQGTLVFDAAGGGGGGGGGGAGVLGGAGGGGGSYLPFPFPGGDGSGPGFGAGGGYAAHAGGYGTNGSPAANSSSGGGGGGGGAGWSGGGQGGSGATGDGGGGGGGTGNSYVNPDLVSNPQTGPEPPNTGPDGAVVISYTAPSASPLSKLQCAGRPATMVVKGPVLVNGTTKSDVIVGDRGANQINGNSGNDTICGGNDQADGVSDRLMGGQGNDRLYGQAGNDILSGGPGNDMISGGRGNDIISGGPGNDRITPGPGRDRVNAGAGNDIIYSRDGQRDVIDCGPGKDVAIVDAFDRTRHCETVIRPHRHRRHPTPPTSRG